MATFDDLTSTVNQLATDLNNLIAAVKGIPAGTLDPASQTALDAAVAQIQTVDTEVTTETTDIETPAPAAPPA